MKAILVIDIPVDESQEIDEYGMVADLKVRPITLTAREDLFFEVKNVPIRPTPEKDKPFKEAGRYQKGWVKGYNTCLDEILGETE